MILANNPPAVVMKAFTWAYEELGLACCEAAQILGISERGLRETSLVGFEVASVESELQISFIKMYHLLYAMSDGDNDAMLDWFNHYNPHLDVVPKQACTNLPGICYVSDYLQSLQSEPATPVPSMVTNSPLEPNEPDMVAR